MSKEIAGDTSAEPGAGRLPFVLVLLGSVALASFLILCTHGTRPVLGDEAYHLRRVFNYYEAPLGSIRVTHDPAYRPNDPSALLYYDTCLWHLGLASIWKALGSASVAAAQIYQAGFTVVLLVFTYLTGRALYGSRGGLWAWGLMATLPMTVLFTMVFYMEIPMLAFAAVAVWCLERGRPISLGVALAAMFLTKSATAAVLIPPLLAGAVLLLGTTWRQRLLRTAMASAAAIAVMLPDMIWRQEHFGRLMMLPPHSAPLAATYPKEMLAELNSFAEQLKFGLSPMSLFDPLVLLQLFGVTGLAAMAAALAVILWSVLGAWRQGWKRPLSVVAALGRDVPLDRRRTMVGVLGLMMVFYVCVFCVYVVMLCRCYDVRYLYPIMLPLCLLMGGALARWQAWPGWARHRWLGRGAIVLLVFAMAGQLLCSPQVIRRLRLLPDKVVAAMEWIKVNTPADAHILYLEHNLTLLTGRPIVWFAAAPQYLFNTSEPSQMRMLRFLRVDYIAVHPTRKQEASSPAEVPFAYPKPWLESLPGRPYLACVYPPPGASGDGNGGEFLIYRVHYSKVPADWLKDVEGAPWPESPVRRPCPTAPGSDNVGGLLR